MQTQISGFSQKIKCFVTIDSTFAAPTIQLSLSEGEHFWLATVPTLPSYHPDPDLRVSCHFIIFQLAGTTPLHQLLGLLGIRVSNSGKIRIFGEERQRQLEGSRAEILWA